MLKRFFLKDLFCIVLLYNIAIQTLNDKKMEYLVIFDGMVHFVIYPEDLCEHQQNGFCEVIDDFEDENEAYECAEHLNKLAHV